MRRLRAAGRTTTMMTFVIDSKGEAMTAEEIRSMPPHQFHRLFPGCFQWNAPPTFAVGEIVVSKFHYGEKRRAFKVDGHWPPSTIDPKGWTIHAKGVEVKGYETGERFTTGWEGYFESLELAQLNDSWAASQKVTQPKRDSWLRRLLLKLADFA